MCILEFTPSQNYPITELAVAVETPDRYAQRDIMRPVPLDYIVACTIAVCTALIGQQLASNISEATQPQGTAKISSLKFDVGDNTYRVMKNQQCIGVLTVRARAESVIGVFVDAQVRVSRENTVLKASSHSSFAFNPLLQLYEATVNLALESKKLVEIQLKNVHPHEISIMGESISPIQFAIPGPITLSPNRFRTAFEVFAPQEVTFPTALPSSTNLLQRFGVTIERTLEPQNDLGTLGCDSKNALNLNELESTLRSIIPKGFAS